MKLAIDQAGGKGKKAKPPFNTVWQLYKMQILYNKGSWLIKYWQNRLELVHDKRPPWLRVCRQNTQYILNKLSKPTKLKTRARIVLQ